MALNHDQFVRVHPKRWKHKAILKPQKPSVWLPVSEPIRPRAQGGLPGDTVRHSNNSRTDDPENGGTHTCYSEGLGTP